MDKSKCHLNDIWSRQTYFELIFKKKKIFPLRDSLDPVYTVPDPDLDCLPMLNISWPNERWDEFNCDAILKE